MKNIGSLAKITMVGMLSVINWGAVMAEEGYQIGLSMYSLRQLFEVQGGDLDPLDYPAFAKDTFGITQVDIWDGAFPKDRRFDPDYYRELKQRAEAVGSNIFLLMTGAVDAQAKDIAANTQKHTRAIDLAEVVGATYVRYFLRTPKKMDRSAALAKSLAVLRPIADYAQSKGIIAVIEPSPNHHSGDGVFLAELAKTLDHPALRLMPDFGKMKLDDPYGGTVAMMPYTAVVSAKSHDFAEDGSSVDFDYARLMASVLAAGFSGIVAVEYEGENLAPVAGVRATQQLLEKLNKP